MVIVAVDPNKKDLKMLVKYLRMAYPGSEIVMFCDPVAAADFIYENPIDVLFTEAPMLGMSGLKLQQAAEAVQPAVLTVFVTATSDYAGEAIRSRAAGYIVKPVTRPALYEALQETRFCTEGKQ